MTRGIVKTFIANNLYVGAAKLGSTVSMSSHTYIVHLMSPDCLLRELIFNINNTEAIIADPGGWPLSPCGLDENLIILKYSKRYTIYH